MRRLTPDSSKAAPRLVRLADALAAPDASTASAAVREATPDPAELARTERDRAFEAARDEGKAKGLADAEVEVSRRVDVISKRLEAEHRAAMQTLETRAAGLSKLIAAASAAVADHARDAEEVAVEAAFAALLKILGEKAAQRSLVRDYCREALAARGAGQATLRLAPEDCEGLELEAADLQVVADPALAPGQCVLESNRGTSDTGLDVRLEAMKRAFLDGLSGHRQAG
jgi:flagellar assembly protein FliH